MPTFMRKGRTVNHFEEDKAYEEAEIDLDEYSDAYWYSDRLVYSNI